MRPRTLTPPQRSLPDLFPLHRTALAAQAQTPSANAALSAHKLTDGGATTVRSPPSNSDCPFPLQPCRANPHSRR